MTIALLPPSTEVEFWQKKGHFLRMRMGENILHLKRRSINVINVCRLVFYNTFSFSCKRNWNFFNLSRRCNAITIVLFDRE